MAHAPMMQRAVRAHKRPPPIADQKTCYPVVTYDPSKPNNYGINLENFGVAPDVWVENSPDDELAGHDRELEGAVDEALRMLEEGNWQYGEDD